MGETLSKLKSIAHWLEQKFNQESEDYSIFEGAKPTVLKYDEHTAVSTWGCGAVVLMGSLLYFIGEDDGNWFVREEENDHYPDYGFQSHFSIGWAKGFREAIERLEEYAEKNGHPVYFSGLEEKIICHYSL